MGIRGRAEGLGNRLGVRIDQSDRAVIREAFSGAEIGVPGYPATHPAAMNAETDVQHLAAKVATGTDAIFKQLFFDTDRFVRFPPWVEGFRDFSQPEPTPVGLLWATPIERFGPTKVLIAVDGSPCSYAAVAEVSRRPWPAKSKFRLLTVDAPVSPDVTRAGSPTIFDELVRQLSSEAVRHLNVAVALFKENAPTLSVTPILREGWPKEVILDEAESWNADLIVLGSHGYGTIRRMFLGSVSLAIATSAPCSVEMVRARPCAPGELAAGTE